MPTPQRVLVLGIGNPLMLDEGIGVRVLEEMASHYTFAEGTELVDAGTMGLGMINMFRGIDFMLIIDAIDGTGHPAGTVVRVSPKDFSPNQVFHGLHDVRFVDVLNSASLIGIEPEAECVGIQVQDMSPPELTVGLSEPVEASVPRAVAAALTLLDERGIPFTEISNPDSEPFFELVRSAYEEMRDKRRDH
ncbi:MAG: hydrogenase maturation protease [Coriobacteriia bacterium]|nr:hydrogenase maturation protease [Coriobacteriia bacterium]MBN2823530.1 hydrogenase maturation protease [Coriobacteriia bacterium]